jgi:hypothetical protein
MARITRKKRGWDSGNRRKGNSNKMYAGQRRMRGTEISLQRARAQIKNAALRRSGGRRGINSRRYLTNENGFKMDDPSIVHLAKYLPADAAFPAFPPHFHTAYPLTGTSFWTVLP